MSGRFTTPQSYPESVPNISVEGIHVDALMYPPARKFPDAGLAYSTSYAAQRQITKPRPPLWEPQDFSNERDTIHYVPMNSNGHVTRYSPGYIVTSNLYGCVAIAAGYQDKKESATDLFLAHYDDVSVRELDENGELRVSGLLTQFAGERAVKLAVAYPGAHHPNRASWDYFRPDDYPIEAIVKGFRRLAAGSSALLIPYENPRTTITADTAHMLGVGLGGAYSLAFAWNGHPISVGRPEKFDERRRAAARGLAEAMEAEFNQEHDVLE